ncbi:MAG: acyltransferase [Ferruginibacter sp.]
MTDQLVVSPTKKNELDSLVLLRGIAVILVCFCHFANPLTSGHFFSKLFENFHLYGKYGVHIFFVISGFVIPLSLFYGKYRLRDYPRFLYKRLLRLHPPYLAALVITLIIVFFSYKVRHIAFPESVPSILKSLVYLHAPADNPVFWTLLVEAQYYLLIGLLYSLLMNWPRIALLVFIPILVLLTQTPIVGNVMLFQYLAFFLIGTAGFLIYTNNGVRILNFAFLISILAFIAFRYEIPAFISSFSAIFIILTYRRSVPEYLKFPGKISYSIYLLHFPVGVKLINLLKPRIDLSYSWMLFIFTLAIVFIISLLFYKVFEEYSEKLSKKIKYEAFKKQTDPKF